MQYQVNNTTLGYQAEGERVVGDDKVLLADATDLTAEKGWHEQGFTIAQLFEPEQFKVFAGSIQELLVSSWRSAGLKVADDFPLHQYHTLVKSHEQHLAAVDKTKLISTAVFPMGIETIEKRISEICKVPLIARNPFDSQRVFHFRVIRPLSRDNNPLHRDVWLEDYDNCINLYIPVAGSNALSSLILFPGSHLWPESRIERTKSGAAINGIKFNVPAVTAILGDFKIERPNPNLNEVLVFSPYLIHGGAVNLNTDTTRISIELRLWKA